VSSIVANATLLQDAGAWNEEIVKELTQASSFLLEMLNNTLDISKLEEGKIEFNNNYETVSNVVDVVLNIAKSNANKKQIHLKAEYSRMLPHLLKLDKSRLTQVVLNLVGNAIKFTPQCGNVTVSLGWRWNCGLNNGDCETCNARLSPLSDKPSSNDLTPLSGGHDTPTPIMKVCLVHDSL
jgi:signal transduction histidine kinase